MIRTGRIVLPARGRGIFSPVFIANLVDGIVSAGDSERASGEVFTVTDGIGVTTRDFFGRYSAMLGKPPPPAAPNWIATPGSALVHHAARLARVPNELNPDTVAYLSRTGTYSIAKAHERLGYEPRVGLDEGFEVTERWLSETGHL